LGLVQPLLILTGHRRSTPASEPVPPHHPLNETERSAPAWTHYYAALLTKRELGGPWPTPAFDDLMRDFVARGSEVMGRPQQTKQPLFGRGGIAATTKQVNLRPYWQWVVSTYGPALLESLGTFRFLLTELVPLGLIFTGSGDTPVANLDDTPDESAF
jgi:hypothetical protein